MPTFEPLRPQRWSFRAAKVGTRPRGLIPFRRYEGGHGAREGEAAGVGPEIKKISEPETNSHNQRRGGGSMVSMAVSRLLCSWFNAKPCQLVFSIEFASQFGHDILFEKKNGLVRPKKNKTRI